MQYPSTSTSTLVVSFQSFVQPSYQPFQPPHSDGLSINPLGFFRKEVEDAASYNGEQTHITHVCICFAIWNHWYHCKTSKNTFQEGLIFSKAAGCGLTAGLFLFCKRANNPNCKTPHINILKKIVVNLRQDVNHYYLKNLICISICLNP